MDDTQYELRYLPLFYEDLEQKVIYISETLHNEKSWKLDVFYIINKTENS